MLCTSDYTEFYVTRSASCVFPQDTGTKTSDPIGQDVSKWLPDMQSQELMWRLRLPTGRQVKDTFDSKSLNKRDSSVIYTYFEFQTPLIFLSYDKNTWLKTYLTSCLEKESLFTRVGITKCCQCESHLIDLVRVSTHSKNVLSCTLAKGQLSTCVCVCVWLLYLV